MSKPHIRLRRNAALMDETGGSTANTRNDYDGGSITANDVRAWLPARRSVDAEILPNWDVLVSRSRDSDRNNPIAKGARQTIVDNVVGTGPRLLSEPSYEVLGQTPEWALEWGEQFERSFHAWWWSTACHAADTLTGDQLAQQAQAAQVMNGDA